LAESQEINVFDDLVALIADFAFAKAFGLPDLHPVGGAITSAGKTAGIDEGLAEDDGDLVAELPVISGAFDPLREKPRGEIANLDPREDGEAKVIEHAAEKASALSLVPAHIPVAAGDVPGTAAPAEGGDGEILDGSKIFKESAGDAAETQIMIGMGHGIP
jgi:hypothetical protein